MFFALKNIKKKIAQKTASKILKPPVTYIFHISDVAGNGAVIQYFLS